MGLGGGSSRWLGCGLRSGDRSGRWREPLDLAFEGGDAGGEALGDQA